MPRKKKKAKRGRATRRRGIANRAGHDAVVIERRGRALGFRLDGYRYREIAAENQCSLDTAWNDVQDALAETNALSAERAEELRTLEVARLDRYLHELQSIIAGSDIEPKMRAISRAIDIATRRAKLLGLDVEKTAPDFDQFRRTVLALQNILLTHIRDQRILDVISDEFESHLERLTARVAFLPAAPVDHS